MSMEIARNYGGCKACGKNEKPPETEKTAGGEKNAEYLEKLNRRFPSLKIEAVGCLPTGNDGRISFGISPALLEKMRSDPAREKETMELLEGAVQARKLITALHRTTGWEYEYSHDYIDANGKFWHAARSVKKDPVNEEMRKKTREDTEKRIDEAVKKARIKRKELIEMIKSDVREPEKTAPKNSDTLELSEGALIAMKKRAEEQDKTGDAASDEGDEAEKSGSADETESSESRCCVAVNVGKRMRMIAAAETPDQVRVVLDLLQGDLEDCREGLENGWCDEEEVKKAEALIELANKRMSEVAGNEEKDTAGVGAFELSMLF